MLGTTGFGEPPLIGSDAGVGVWAAIGKLDTQSLLVMEQPASPSGFLASSELKYQLEEMISQSNTPPPPPPPSDGYYRGKSVQLIDDGISNCIMFTDPGISLPTGESSDAFLTPHDEYHTSMTIELTGRDCPVEHAAARDSLSDLYNNSPTARALIDAVSANGTDLNLIKVNLTGYEPKVQFFSESNRIDWDPFTY